MSKRRIDEVVRAAAADKNRLRRFCTIQIDAESIKGPKQRPDGSWELDGVATRGDAVFDYSSEAGEEWREYRPLDQVFAETSRASLEFATLTDDHPEEFVTVYNARDLTRGVVMKAWQDGNLMRVRVLVRDAELLEKLQAGKVALSCGYTCVVVPSLGEHPTEGAYQAIQTDIIHNHLAVVDAGRAGPVAALVVPPQLIAPAPAGDKRPDKAGTSRENGMGSKKKDMTEIVINGASFAVDPNATAVPQAVAEAWAAADQTIQQLTARITELEQQIAAKQNPQPAAPAPALTPAAPNPNPNEPEGAMGDKAGDKSDKKDHITRADVEQMLDASNKAAELRARVVADAAPVLPSGYEIAGKSNEQILADAIVALDADYKAKAEAMVKGKQVDALRAVLDVKLHDRGRDKVIDFGTVLSQARDRAGNGGGADKARADMINRKRGIRPDKAAAGGEE